MLNIRMANSDALVKANVAMAQEYLKEMEYRQSNPAEVAKALSEAHATEGSVQLINSMRIAPITQEALMRGWVMEFGTVKTAKQGEMPAYRTRSRKRVGVTEVGPNGKSVMRKYANVDSIAYGSWNEISTDIIEVDLFNPMYPNAAAENEAEAHKEAAYALNKEMHKRAKTLIDAGIGAFGADVWTYKDDDVVGIPTTNTFDTSTESTAALKVEKMLKSAAKFFSGQGKSGVINLHIHVDDEDVIWGLVPLVQNSPYTPAQEQIFKSGTLLNAYGHQFRIIPENYGVAAGYAYCTIGESCFDMFLMDLGEWGGVQEVKPLHPKRSAFFVTQYLSFMQPAPYKTNYCRIKFA